MKYSILILALLFVACKKDDPRACYTCIQPYIIDDTVGGRHQIDTARYCDKTEKDIQDIIASSPYGKIGDRHYTRKTCKKD